MSLASHITKQIYAFEKLERKKPNFLILSSELKRKLEEELNLMSSIDMIGARNVTRFNGVIVVEMKVTYGGSAEWALGL